MQVTQRRARGPWATGVFLSMFLMMSSCLSPVSLLNPPPVSSALQSAFSATRSSSMTGGQQRAVTFDRLTVNIGADFNLDTGFFRCRIPGAYYFSFSVGKFPKKMLSVILVKNGAEVQAIAYDDYRKKGRKVQSQSVMVMLKEMDTVWLRIQQSPQYALYSNVGPYITFSGYLVYPEASISNHLPSSSGLSSSGLSSSGPSSSGLTSSGPSSSVPSSSSVLPQPPCPSQTDPQMGPWSGLEQGPRSAFSVARTSSLLGQRRLQELKPALTFDVEYVNIGGHFNRSSGVFTCFYPGTYYFAFTVGKHPRKAVSVKLMRGQGDVQAMVFDEDTSKRREMQSQSLLLSLHRGDTVWLYSQQDERFAVYSNQGRYTTFSGFLLYPEPPSSYSAHGGQSTGAHSTGAHNTGAHNIHSTYSTHSTGAHNTGVHNTHSTGAHNTGVHNTLSTGAHNTGAHNTHSTGAHNTGVHNTLSTGAHNTGAHNTHSTGAHNTGAHNTHSTGAHNTGVHNTLSTGAHNTGVHNTLSTGAHNTGAHNTHSTGAHNTGAHNTHSTGAHNTGVHNTLSTGAHNTGAHNTHSTGAHNTGVHNTRSTGAHNTGVHNTHSTGAHNTGAHNTHSTGAHTQDRTLL